MMNRLPITIWLIVLGAILSSTDGTKNVLFISVDDLRPEVEPYAGALKTYQDLSQDIRTPNIAALAKRSIVFHNAYAQEPLCAPSRASILTGRRPDTTNVHDLDLSFRTVGGNFTTIPQFYKERGYTTIGIGKIFHDGNKPWSDDNEFSWSETFWRANKRWEFTCCSSKAIETFVEVGAPLRDTQIANEAIIKLRNVTLTRGTKPFFLAVGFHKPHLPFVYPENFTVNFNAIAPLNPHASQNMPEIAWSRYKNLRKYGDIKDINVTGNFNTTIPEDKTLELRKAYYSTVTYIDHQIGRLLQEINNTAELINNTVVVLWSDHGFHLGENGEWCKTTAFELSAWAPLMFSIPGQTDEGVITKELVELVDIFPTLTEATGHTVPDQCADDSSSQPLCVEGISLLPLVSSPLTPLKNASFTQVKRNEKTMGYSIRTKEYRYTEWYGYDSSTRTTQWNSLRVKELYVLSTDEYETKNEAANHIYADVISGLHDNIRAGWKQAIIN